MILASVDPNTVQSQNPWFKRFILCKHTHNVYDFFDEKIHVRTKGKRAGKCRNDRKVLS